MASGVEGKFLSISWRFHWPHLVVQVNELITCVWRGNEKARNLICVVHICFTFYGIFLVEILCDQLFFDRYVALYRYICRRIQVVQACKPDRVLDIYICSSILVTQACKSDRVIETLKKHGNVNKWNLLFDYIELLFFHHLSYLINELWNSSL